MVTTTTGLATSFITFTRTSNATVTDSNGFIEWAGHNLLTNSESFDAAVWTKASVTVSANSTSAPNGTTTADKIISTSGTGEQRVYTASSVIPSTVGIRYTFSVFAKADGANWLVIRDALSGFGDTSFDLVNGAVGTVASGRTATITSVGNGFYLCSVSNTVTASYVVGDISYCLADADNGRATFVGNGTKALILWGAHLYRSDLGGMVLNPARGDAYYPTTPRNLFGFTEDFANAGWTKTQLLAFGSGSVSNAIIAPNGLQTADLVVPNTSNTAHNILQFATLSANVLTLSVYAKPNGYNFIVLQVNDNVSNGAGTSFNLTGTGTIVGDVTTGTWTVASKAISPVGDGWYRCSVVLNVTGTTRKCEIEIRSTNSTSWGASYTGDGTSGIYLWGAQLSDSASLDAYSPVYGAAVTSAAYYAPRLDYDPVTLAAKGLLVEEQRTNSITHSEAFDNAAWSRQGLLAFGSGSVANAIVSPSGATTADLIVEAATTADHFVYQDIPTLTAAGTYTFSFYAKYSGRFVLAALSNTISGDAYVYFNLQTGVISQAATVTGPMWASASATITPVGSDWYRCTLTATKDAVGNVQPQIRLASTGTGSSSQSYAGDGTSGVYVYGAQLEAGSFATSYIPTGAATATRTADVASVSTQAFPYSASASTLVANVSLLSTAPITAMFALSDGTINNFINTYQSTGTAEAQVYSGGAPQAGISRTTVTAGGQTKIGVAVAANDAAFVLNGGTAGTDPTVTMPNAASTLYLGLNFNGTSNPINGHIRQITYLPRRITDAELIARTA